MIKKRTFLITIKKKKHLREEVFFPAPEGAKAYNRVGVESEFNHYPRFIVLSSFELGMYKI